MIISQNSLNKLEAELQRKDSEYAIFDSYARIIYFIDEIRDANAYSYDKHLFLIYNKQEFIDKKKDRRNIEKIIENYDYIKAFRDHIIQVVRKYDFIEEKEKVEDEISKKLSAYNELKIFFQSLEKILPYDFLSYNARVKKKLTLADLLKTKKLSQLGDVTGLSEIDEILKLYEKVERFLLSDDIYLDDDKIDAEDSRAKGIAEEIMQNYLIRAFSRILKKTSLAEKKYSEELLEEMKTYIDYKSDKKSFLSHKNKIIQDLIEKIKDENQDKNKKANAKRIYSYIYNSLKYNHLYNKTAVEKNSRKKPSKDDAQKEILEFRCVEYEEEIENSYLKKWEEEMKRFHEIPMLKF